MGINTYFSNSVSSLLDGINDLYIPTADLEEDIVAFGWRTVAIASIALAVATVLAVLTKNSVPKLKLPLFIIMASAMSFSFLILAGSTIYLNVKSDSGGPVHWHADFEYWVCGNEVELRDPTGTLSNKIGTSTLHEHDDHRVHLEGVVVDGVKDASLGKFNHVIGGAVTDDALVIPVNDDQFFEDDEDGDGLSAPNPDDVTAHIIENDDGKFVRVEDGMTCGGQAAEVQVFAIKYDQNNDTYKQTKINRPQDYIITDDSNVPPGDCIIYEFDVLKTRTEKLCKQYGVRDVLRCSQFGVAEEQRGICKATENLEAT